MMYRLLWVAAFACCVITATALCNEFKYLQGERYWLKCAQSNVDEVKSRLKMSLAAITISHSTIEEIPSAMFARNATTIEELMIQNCGVSRIASDAFRSLVSLKLMSLAYNELTELNPAWFYDLTSLEKLDLSYNKISSLNPMVYFHLSKLQRFDINDNQLREIPLENIENMERLEEIKIEGNPLTYSNRAKLTLLLKDRKITWTTKDDTIAWLDRVLWQCSMQSLMDSPNRESKIDICALTSMFNQLTTLLIESPTLSTSTEQCMPFRKSLTTCLKQRNVNTNGQMLANLLALTHDAAGL